VRVKRAYTARRALACIALPLVPGVLHARRPRRAREGCHRTTESGLQPPAPSLGVVQRQKSMLLTRSSTLYVMNGASSGVRGPLRGLPGP
jgi:hypothetical protein